MVYISHMGVSWYMCPWIALGYMYIQVDLLHEGYMYLFNLLDKVKLFSKVIINLHSYPLHIPIIGGWRKYKTF